jgi:hypothetical protein
LTSFILASIEASLPEKAAGWQDRSPFFKITLVFVRLDHIASRIVNANHGIMRMAAMHGIANCVLNGI